MEKPVEICLAVLGNRELGNRHMVFDRLAWWLTRKGAIEMTRLEDDPAWDELLVVGFDADGKPLEFPLEAEDAILATLGDGGSKPLPLAEAETSVAETLGSGLVGEPMTSTNRREKARVNILRHMYDGRRKAWPEPQQETS